MVINTLMCGESVVYFGTIGRAKKLNLRSENVSDALRLVSNSGVLAVL